MAKVFHVKRNKLQGECRNIFFMSMEIATNFEVVNLG